MEREKDNSVLRFIELCSNESTPGIYKLLATPGTNQSSRENFNDYVALSGHQLIGGNRRYITPRRSNIDQTNLSGFVL
jgi:hypothetical protein